MSQEIKYHVGCNDFSHENWCGKFYPQGLERERFLDFYCQCFSTVELGHTFYRLPDFTLFDKWAYNTPDEFRFSVFGNKLITHHQGLKGVKMLVEQFLDRSAALREKLGVILWRIPADLKPNRALLADFLSLLREGPKVRHCFQFDHDGWHTKEIYQDIRRARAAVAVTGNGDDQAADFDFLYVRREWGPPEDESRARIEQDAKLVKKALRRGQEVFVYYDHPEDCRAPENARALLELLKPKSEKKKTSASKTGASPQKRKTR